MMLRRWSWVATTCSFEVCALARRDFYFADTMQLCDSAAATDGVITFNTATGQEVLAVMSIHSCIGDNPMRDEIVSQRRGNAVSRVFTLYCRSNKRQDLAYIKAFAGFEEPVGTLFWSRVK